MKYYRRYMGDYLRDTARLSMLEHGAYTLLLDHYYAEELPIPGDAEEVYRIVRALHPAERKAVDRVLASFFHKREDGHHHKRVDQELRTAGQARINGRKGGRSSTGQQTETLTGFETGSITERATEHQTGSGHPPDFKPPDFKPPASNHQDRATALPSAPEWLPADSWTAFVEMRRRIRKPMTARAEQLAIEKLDALRTAGHDPKIVLDQSVFNSWQGLFPVKVQGSERPRAAIAAFVANGAKP